MWSLPPKALLKKSPPLDEHEEMENAWQEAGRIEDKTEELGSRLNIEGIKIGPQVTLYAAIPAEKIRVASLGKLKDEIAFELGAESVSIQSPIPGEKLIGISISRANRRLVTLGDVI